MDSEDAGRGVHGESADQGSVGSATLLMIGLSILLFWIPTVGR
jgi:hypothetical protein